MREVWRQAHLKQPLGSRDGSRTRQGGGSGPKSTTGVSRGGSSSMGRAGGVLHQITGKRPHICSTSSALNCVSEGDGDRHAAKPRYASCVSRVISGHLGPLHPGGGGATLY